MKNSKEYRPTASQMNPDRITTDTVQLWQNGIMVTAMIKNEEAKEMIKNRQAFVITEQAIGSMSNGISVA